MNTINIIVNKLKINNSEIVLIDKSNAVIIADTYS